MTMLRDAMRAELVEVKAHSVDDLFFLAGASGWDAAVIGADPHASGAIRCQPQPMQEALALARVVSGGIGCRLVRVFQRSLFLTVTDFGEGAER